MKNTERKNVPSSSLDKAEKAVEKLEAQYKRARERVRKLETDLHAARKDVARERVKLLVGKPVKYGTWLSSSNRYAWINNAVGILQKVNRKRGVVDFGERGSVTMPIDDILPAEDPRTSIAMDAMIGDKAVSDQWFAASSKKEGGE